MTYENHAVKKMNQKVFEHLMQRSKLFHFRTKTKLYLAKNQC